MVQKRPLSSLIVVHSLIIHTNEKGIENKDSFTNGAVLATPTKRRTIQTDAYLKHTHTLTPVAFFFGFDFSFSKQR